MKISFLPAYAAPISNFSHRNCVSNPASYKNSNEKYDTFVKSNVSFGSVDQEIIREHVVDMGSRCILRLMTEQSMLEATASKMSKLPDSENFDRAMYRCFDTMATSRWAYSGATGVIPAFPTEDEFVVIMQKLWTDGGKNDTIADHEKIYADVDPRKLHYPAEIKAASEPFIKADFGRALGKYAEKTYSINLNNEDDVEKFARKLYNDDSVCHFRPEFADDINGYYTRKMELMNAREWALYLSTPEVLEVGPSLRERYREQQAAIRNGGSGASYDDGDYSEADKYGTVF